MQHHNLKDFSYWASWMVWLTIINAIGVVIMIIAGLVRSFVHTNRIDFEHYIVHTCKFRGVVLVVLFDNSCVIGYCVVPDNML